MSGKRPFGRQEVVHVDADPGMNLVWPLLKDIPKWKLHRWCFLLGRPRWRRSSLPPVWVTLCFVYCDVLCFNASVLEQLLCLVATESIVMECSYCFCRIQHCSLLATNALQFFINLSLVVVWNLFWSLVLLILALILWRSAFGAWHDHACT